MVCKGEGRYTGYSNRISLLVMLGMLDVLMYLPNFEIRSHIMQTQKRLKSRESCIWTSEKLRNLTEHVYISQWIFYWPH